MNKKPFIVPIPGTTKLSHLEENLRATDVVFTDDEVKELEKIISSIPVMGNRYDALQESKVQNMATMPMFSTKNLLAHVNIRWYSLME